MSGITAAPKKITIQNEDFNQEVEPQKTPIWYRPSTNEMYVYHGDFNTEDADYKQADMPDAGSPDEGNIWLKTDTGELFVWVE